MVDTGVGHTRKNDCDVYAGRGKNGDAHLLNTPPGTRGWLGNPHPVGWCSHCEKEHTRTEAINAYRDEFHKKIETDPEFRQAVERIQGNVLGCWCRSLDEETPACHVDVIVEWLDSGQSRLNEFETSH